MLLGEQEAKMVVDKGSLVFRFPIERNYPEGIVIRPLAENEFIQSEGDRLCVYRRGPDDDIHYVCRVNLLERVTPKGAARLMKPRSMRMKKIWKHGSNGSSKPERQLRIEVGASAESWFLHYPLHMSGDSHSGQER